MESIPKTKFKEKTFFPLYELKVFAPLTLGVDPNWSIEDYLKF